MGNRVISYSLRGFTVFLNVPVIIIIRFGEHNLLGTIYINFGGGRRLGVINWFTLKKKLLFIKTEKLQEHEIKFYIFLINNLFPMMNNKKVTKRGPQFF